MNFNEAFKAMKNGSKAKLPGWGGYWYWDEEKTDGYDPVQSTGC